jgi:hypothetical protein
MIFGRPARITGFPRFLLLRVKGMGWCLTDSDACDPVFIGPDCWYSRKSDLIAALEPLRDSHIPMRTGCVTRMLPRTCLTHPDTQAHG